MTIDKKQLLPVLTALQKATSKDVRYKSFQLVSEQEMLTITASTGQTTVVFQLPAKLEPFDICVEATALVKAIKVANEEIKFSVEESGWDRNLVIWSEKNKQVVPLSSYAPDSNVSPHNLFHNPVSLDTAGDFDWNDNSNTAQRFVYVQGAMNEKLQCLNIGDEVLVSTNDGMSKYLGIAHPELFLILKQLNKLAPEAIVNVEFNDSSINFEFRNEFDEQFCFVTHSAKGIAQELGEIYESLDTAFNMPNDCVTLVVTRKQLRDLVTASGRLPTGNDTVFRITQQNGVIVFTDKGTEQARFAFPVDDSYELTNPVYISTNALKIVTNGHLSKEEAVVEIREGGYPVKVVWQNDVRYYIKTWK